MVKCSAADVLTQVSGGHRFRALLSILLLVILAPPAAAQNPPPPFSPGETLTYDVTWTIFRAGVVTVNLHDLQQKDHDAYEITATALSEGFVNVLFAVNNVFRAVSDPQTLCSEGITKKISEGRRQKDTHITFDYSRKLALLDERDLIQPKAPPKHQEFDIPPCVEDIVTAFYYLRRQRMEIGHNIELPVNDGSKTQKVIVDVQAREKVQTPMGTFDAIRIEPKVFNGLLKHKGRMFIWLSDEPRQLPLRIKAEITVGTITGTLRSVTYPKANPPR